MDMINFFLPPDGECSSSSKSKFYLYDDGDATPVYLKEEEIRRNCTPVASWMAEAYKQLLQTILDFKNSHPAVANAARVRRAYAANSRHPNFQFSQADVMRRFRCVTGFLLRFENCASMG